MATLNESVASQLRAAADSVEQSATRDGGGDNLYDEGDGRVEVSIEAMEKLRSALNRCMGKSAFYVDPDKWT